MIALNEYFDGAVKSLGYEVAGSKSTVGVIDSGEFEFGTSTHETMYIVEGDLQVLLPGDEEWQLVSSGQEFEVDANQSFKVKAESPVAYLCKYE